MKLKALFLLGMVFFWLSSAYGQEPKNTHVPLLIPSLRFSVPLNLCGEEVPLNIQEIRERFEKELLLSLWNRPQVILWLKRCPRYLSYIEKMLKENNLPDYLKYIAIAESALRPHASSTKGAIGFWQFIRNTGRDYGLTINQYLDERRNLFASTEAAIRYFKDLYERFASWTLVAAAYNMGEQGLEAEILEQGTTNFYRLYLPLETQRFIFRILSVKLIVSNPQHYGFHLAGDELYAPLKFDRIRLK